MKKYNKPTIQIYNVSSAELMTDFIIGSKEGSEDDTFSKGTGSGSNMWEYMDDED